MKGRLAIAVFVTASVVTVSSSATTGAANTSSSCRSAAGADACLELSPGRFFTPAEATRVVRALWAAREHDRAVRARSYSSIETGSAELTDVEIIDNARCGCSPYLWTHGQRRLRSTTIYLPRQRSYPLYVMASVLAAVPGRTPPSSGTTALLILTRKSAAKPWHIAVQIWDTAYQRPNPKFISPLVDGQNYELSATSPPVSATRLWFPMFVAYMNKIKRTGRQPARSKFAPGPLTSGNGLEARPNGFTRGGERATYHFRSGRFGGPWAFTTTGGTFVCGDVTENVLTKSSRPGGLLRQTRNRRNWGWDLVPGVYRSITSVWEWPICIYPAGSKLGVGGDLGGGYPLQERGQRVGPLP
jgi:hypothetical protein